MELTAKKEVNTTYNPNMLQEILAASSQIAPHYFALPVADLPEPLLRERVYCYELYHQLRLILPEDGRVVLTGEVDKARNPSFRERRCIPDLIFHEPGNHNQNQTVVEVECRVDRIPLRKDFRTFALFRQKGYRELILLLFGIGETPWDLLYEAAAAAGIALETVTVVLHSAPGQAATVQRMPGHFR